MNILTYIVIGCILASPSIVKMEKSCKRFQTLSFSSLHFIINDDPKPGL